MPTYTITFTDPITNNDSSFQCNDTTYLLNAAEEAGFDWPYVGREGQDAVSAARLVSGTVDQSEQKYLQEEQVADGYVLTDVAYPRSDCVLVIRQERAIPCL